MIQFFNQIIQQLSGSGIHPTEDMVSPQGEMQLQSLDKPTFAQSLFSFLGGKDAKEQQNLGPPGSLQESAEMAFSGLSLFVPPSSKEVPVSDQPLIIPTEALIENEDVETFEQGKNPAHLQVMALFKSQADSFQQPTMQLRVVDTSQFKTNDVLPVEQAIPSSREASHLTLVKSAADPQVLQAASSKANTLVEPVQNNINEQPIIQGKSADVQSIPQPIQVEQGNAKPLVKPLAVQEEVIPEPVPVEAANKGNRSSSPATTHKPNGAMPMPASFEQTPVPKEAVSNSIGQAPLAVMPKELPRQDKAQMVLQAVPKTVSVSEKNSLQETYPGIAQVRANTQVQAAQAVPVKVPFRASNNHLAIQSEITTEEIKIRSSILHVQKSEMAIPIKEVITTGLQEAVATELELENDQTITIKKEAPVVSKKMIVDQSPIESKVHTESMDNAKPIVKASGVKPEVNHVEAPVRAALEMTSKKQEVRLPEASLSNQSQTEQSEIAVSNFSSSQEFDLGEHASDKPLIPQETTSTLPKELLERKDFPLRFAKVLQQQQVINQRALNTNTLKPHTFILDNGDVLNVAAKQSEGILTLQIDARNQDIVKIIQQHSDDIKVHLQKQLDVEIDLQLNDFNKQDGTSNWDKSFDGQHKSGKSAVKPDSTGVAEQASVAQESPKFLGFNNNEWVG